MLFCENNFPFPINFPIFIFTLFQSSKGHRTTLLSFPAIILGVPPRYESLSPALTVRCSHSLHYAPFGSLIHTFGGLTAIFMEPPITCEQPCCQYSNQSQNLCMDSALEEDHCLVMRQRSQFWVSHSIVLPHIGKLVCSDSLGLFSDSRWGNAGFPDRPIKHGFLLFSKLTIKPCQYLLNIYALLIYNMGLIST